MNLLYWNAGCSGVGCGEWADLLSLLYGYKVVLHRATYDRFPHRTS
jgi:hypothetical protein